MEGTSKHVWSFIVFYFSSDSSLTDLGVNVYDQDELEADIMRQLDEVAAQKATEQRIKFTEKELKQIQRDTRGLRGDLTSLTRQINSLLSRSLPDVVLQLQNLKKSRDEKVNTEKNN